MFTNENYFIAFKTFVIPVDFVFQVKMLIYSSLNLTEVQQRLSTVEGGTTTMFKGRAETT